MIQAPTPNPPAIRGIDLRVADGRLVRAGDEWPKHATFKLELLALREPWCRIRRSPKRRKLIDVKVANGRAIYRITRWRGSYVVAELCFAEDFEEA